MDGGEKSKLEETLQDRTGAEVSAPPARTFQPSSHLSQRTCTFSEQPSVPRALKTQSEGQQQPPADTWTSSCLPLSLGFHSKSTTTRDNTRSAAAAHKQPCSRSSARCTAACSQAKMKELLRVDFQTEGIRVHSLRQILPK